MNIEFTLQEAESIFKRLGVRCEVRNPDSIAIVCPYHDDKDFGNAYYTVSKGVHGCFRCGLGGGLIKLIKTKLGVNFKEALKFADKKLEYNPHELDFKKSYGTQLKLKKKSYIPKSYYFDPNVYQYTRDRGYTEEFCRYFNIGICNQGRYEGYIIIPIGDTFEARLLDRSDKERERVLYPAKNNINDTIFNEEGLNRNEDLYITEGSGSLPKIWTHVSKNVTCVFGTKGISIRQANLLNNFKKRKILIFDQDKAGIELIDTLSENIKDLYVIDIKYEDTDRQYIGAIKQAIPIEGTRYLIRMVGILD